MTTFSVVTTTVTVTMTYIPIQTSTKDTFVYVPVNSVQAGPGQPVVLYQQNQQIKDANGKPVLIPQHLLQHNRKGDLPKDQSSGPFTTVRIQGPSHHPNLTHHSGGIHPHQNSFMRNPASAPSTFKPLKYQFGGNIMSNANQNIPISHNELQTYKINGADSTSLVSASGYDRPLNIDENGVDINRIKTEKQGEIMTLINNQLRMVPPHVGVHQTNNANSMVPPHMGIHQTNNANPMQLKQNINSQHNEVPFTSVGVKRKNSSSSSNQLVSSAGHEDIKIKKRRGRPPGRC